MDIQTVEIPHQSFETAFVKEELDVDTSFQINIDEFVKKLRKWQKAEAEGKEDEKMPADLKETIKEYLNRADTELSQ